jgi:glyoxylase-like metal-dependent hydrolase (beta-lactamase superfamily II)
MLRTTRHGDVTRFDLAHTLLGRGRYWTVAYLVDDLLLDSGCAHTARELADALAPSPLARIVNTHSHEDHIGANGILQRRQPAPEILAHEAALPVLADPRRRQPLHPYRKIFWGMPEPSTAKPIADGDEIRTPRHRFRVVATPGHSPDHVCLWEPDERWLFSGDLYIGGRDRALREGYDVWAIIDSLRRVAALPIRTLFPGSARIPENPAAALREKVEHLASLGARVLELHRRGCSVSQIARALLGPPMPIELFTVGNFSRRALVESYLSRA